MNGWMDWEMDEYMDRGSGPNGWMDGCLNQWID